MSSLPRDDAAADTRYHKRDFWSTENLKYSRPHFRMRKCARIVSKLAGDRACDLLDVGCGPASLKQLLGGNISYYGIDIAIQEPAPYLLEHDFLEAPIGFNERQFDIVVAQGVFEYVGTFQEAKFAEIRSLLTERGRFVASYVNFDHRAREIYWPYSNVQPLDDFRASLATHFKIDRSFPTSLSWHHSEPVRPIAQAVQMPVRVNFPIISRRLAVEYFFVCSPG